LVHGEDGKQVEEERKEEGDRKEFKQLELAL